MKRIPLASALFVSLVLTLPRHAADAPAPLAPQVLDAKNAASERAADYEGALARAKATGKDIAVFQYGSDWNPASLSLFQNAWSKDTFLRELGPGFVVVAIDQPEVVGGRAVYGRCTAEKCGLTGFSETAIGNVPPLLLENLAKVDPPANELSVVAAEGGAIFALRADGTFVVDPKGANPAQDTLALTLKPGRAGALLRLDFPCDDTLPAGGPGRTGNGNAVISEVELMQNGQALEAEWAWASVNSGNNFGPWTTLDGNVAKSDEGWNLNGGSRERRTLLLALKSPVAAGADLSIRILCKSQWGQHVPGAVRACVLADADALAAVRTVGAAQQLQCRNNRFTFAGWGKMPRLSLLDAGGRPVAADPSLSIHLTSKDIAAEIKSMRARRERRDALWSKAESAQGPAKAELLRQSLDALHFGRDPEFGCHNGWGTAANGPYGPVLAAMKAADPQDESGAIRWTGFSQGAWGAIPWGKDNEWWKKLDGKPAPTDEDYAEAEACIERELKDPRNKLLDHDAIQHIMKARYDLYLRQFKGDHTHEKILDIQRQIAKVDPDTFWGVGAIGYLGMYRRSDQPFVAYGFDAKYQTKPGAHAWLLADAWKEVDHAGAYKFTVAYGGGKDALKISRVAVMVGGRELGYGKPVAGKDVLGPGNRAVDIPLTVATLPKDAKPVIKVEYEAAGPLELIGGFAVEPVLEE